MAGPWKGNDWVERYGQSHQHPVNRACHLVGIPLIVTSPFVALAALFWQGLWPVALTLFVAGWILQFAGHLVEGKPPEFFRDWRFLLVGLRWWVSKLRGYRE
jgi:uncharacterized membrane protein YGL010W